MDIGPAREFDSAALDSTVPAGTGQQDKHRELVKAVRGVNAASMVGENRVLTISVDQEAKRPVVRIVDSVTHEVVRQIPAEYVLELARNLKRQAD